jgi:hypothetical protein
MIMFSSWLNRFRPKVFEEVINARVHAIVHNEVERLLLPRGFEAVGGLKWVRGGDAPIRQVFQFSKWKDGKVHPVWGISLDFVPHITGKKVAWHRSNKSAKLDLCFDPQTEKLNMSYINGARPIQKQHKYVIGAALQEANRFWEQSRSIDDLPKVIDLLKDFYETAGGLTFNSYTQHPLAVPFILKHLGMKGDALEAFERLHHAFLEPEALQKVRELLAK